MKAVFDFTKISQFEVQGNPFNYSACFLPMMGKPFIQHILEYVERLGIREWEIFLSNSASEVEKFIGDGERWGAKISYHLLRDREKVLSRLSDELLGGMNELFLFCNEEFLPFITKEHLLVEQSFYSLSDIDTGWRISTLASLGSELAVTKVEALNIVSASDYLDSIEKVFANKGEGLVVFGKEIREGIWSGPGTRIPSTSTLVAPVYLGSQVRIDEQSIIGPNVEISNGCIIGGNSFIKGSSILTGSFVGKNLDVNGCIVNQNNILNARLNAVYSAADDMLVTSVEQSQGSSDSVSVSIGSRLLALLLLILTLPIFLTLSLIVKKRYRHTVVSIPQRETDFSHVKTQDIPILRRRSDTTGNLWKHILWHMIPNLYLIVCKKARFFGIPYKTIHEYEQLSLEWKELYLHSIPGLISEADILYDTYPDDQMLFACEMYYHVMDSRSYNLVLLGKYLKRLFTNKVQ